MTVARTICLGFIAVILTGAMLLMMPFSIVSGQWNDPIVALFTATSAVCVTGHVVVDTATYFSRLGQLVIMLLIQVGGLGYMTAMTFLLLLLGRRFGLKDKIAIQQALDHRTLHGSNQILKSIIATTLIFELTGAFLRLLASCTYAILQGQESVVIYRRQISNLLMLKAIAVTFGSLVTVVFATIMIAISDSQLDFINILFEVVSAFATVGLSTGITAGLTSSSKLVLVATMYIGRVGILLLMAAILGESPPTRLRYPAESLLVG
jgi:Trk-type K+ transport system membrane component